MEYVGIQTPQSRNNVRSLFLLCLFPCLVVGLTYLFCFLLHYISMPDDQTDMSLVILYSNDMFLHIVPYVIGGVLIYKGRFTIIRSATRKEEKDGQKHDSEQKWRQQE